MRNRFYFLNSGGGGEHKTMHTNYFIYKIQNFQLQSLKKLPFNTLNLIIISFFNSFEFKGYL
ncbi:hypothetical protein BKH45_01600 [Helicobacter sp. 11S03491-1]|nr:hypothetical protein BKH45_01600 [Helicobacter sp. 11S03491-1]